MAESVYFRLLEKLSALGISIRTEAPFFMPDATAKYVRSWHDGKTVIQLRRTNGGLWLQPNSSFNDKKTLAAGSPDLVEEICNFAHELGHHHSTFEDYERIMTRIRKEPDLVSDQERQAIYDEEVFAWKWAHEFLPTIGFDEMKRFESIAEHALATYKEMWRK